MGGRAGGRGLGWEGELAWILVGHLGKHADPGVEEKNLDMGHTFVNHIHKEAGEYAALAQRNFQRLMLICGRFFFPN